MGFLSNLVTAPFKAVGDVVSGAWKMTGGTALKAIGTVLDAGFKFLTFRWGDAAKTLAKGTMDTVGTFFGGAGQVARGGLMLGGTVAAGAMAFGTGGLGTPWALGTYAATTGVYTALGG